MMDRASILGELDARVPLTVVMETTSTNDDARIAAEGGAPHGATFIADAQTSGRGRGEHHWHSPPGCNVYLSMVLRPSLDPAVMAPLTLAVGVAVARVVDAHLAAPRARIKWPNDIWIDGRKVAGVLLDATTRAGALPLVVAGVGMNVLLRTFPAELAESATSLAIAGGVTLERERIAAELVASLLDACARFQREGFGGIYPELSARDGLRGRRVRVGSIEGIADGIDDRGRLVIVDEGGARHPLWSGEVYTIAR
jgi:BirA family transcriptional regulator, biotin operon repressor / biotin---[acetyl-CoA-carboxylase] ligase